MAKSTNSCAVCLRYFVIIDSVLFVLIGAGVAAVFIYFQLTQVDFVSTVLGTDIVTAANCLLIAGNCLLLVVAFIGIIGGISRVPSAIAANFLLLILVLLSLLAGIVCALVFKTWLTEEVRYGMRDTLKLKYGVDSKVTESWDKAQSLWKCCAVEDQGWSIYVESEWYNQQPGTPAAKSPMLISEDVRQHLRVPQHANKVASLQGKSIQLFTTEVVTSQHRITSCMRTSHGSQ
jgi:hypothetical protein